MPHTYTEDQLVEQPAIGLFAKLGWYVALPRPHPSPFATGEEVKMSRISSRLRVEEDSYSASGIEKEEASAGVFDGYLMEDRKRGSARRVKPMESPVNTGRGFLDGCLIK